MQPNNHFLDLGKKAEITLLFEQIKEETSSEDWTLTDKDKTFMEWLFIEPLPKNGTARIMRLLESIDLD